MMKPGVRSAGCVVKASRPLLSIRPVPARLCLARSGPESKNASKNLLFPLILGSSMFMDAGGAMAGEMISPSSSAALLEHFAQLKAIDQGAYPSSMSIRDRILMQHQQSIGAASAESQNAIVQVLQKYEEILSKSPDAQILKEHLQAIDASIAAAKVRSIHVAMPVQQVKAAHVPTVDNVSKALSKTMAEALPAGRIPALDSVSDALYKSMAQALASMDRLDHAQKAASALSETMESLATAHGNASFNIQSTITSTQAAPGMEATAVYTQADRDKGFNVPVAISAQVAKDAYVPTVDNGGKAFSKAMAEAMASLDKLAQAQKAALTLVQTPIAQRSAARPMETRAPTVDNSGRAFSKAMAEAMASWDKQAQAQKAAFTVAQAPSAPRSPAPTVDNGGRALSKAMAETMATLNQHTQTQTTMPDMDVPTNIAHVPTADNSDDAFSNAVAFVDQQTQAQQDEPIPAQTSAVPIVAAPVTTATVQPYSGMGMSAFTQSVEQAAVEENIGQTVSFVELSVDGAVDTKSAAEEDIAQAVSILESAVDEVVPYSPFSAPIPAEQLAQAEEAADKALLEAHRSLEVAMVQAQESMDQLVEISSSISFEDLLAYRPSVPSPEEFIEQTFAAYAEALARFESLTLKDVVSEEAVKAFYPIGATASVLAGLMLLEMAPKGTQASEESADALVKPFDSVAYRARLDVAMSRASTLQEQIELAIESRSLINMMDAKDWSDDVSDDSGMTTAPERSN